MNFYEATMKVEVVTERGPKTVTEIQLVRAESYGDTEVKMYNQYNGFNFTIDKITKKGYNEFLDTKKESHDTDVFFLAKVNYSTFDEKSQKDKITPFLFVVCVDHENAEIDITFERLNTMLGGMNDYQIAEIKKTKIINYVA